MLSKVERESWITNIVWQRLGDKPCDIKALALYIVSYQKTSKVKLQEILPRNRAFLEIP